MESNEIVQHVPETWTGIIYDLQNHLLLRRTVVKGAFGGSLSGRGDITKFSSSSGARMRRYLRTCEAEYRAFITLTYPSQFPRNGRICKRHLRAFLARYRRRAGHPLWSAFWFIEFQDRGAPHFHIFGTDYVPHEDVAIWWYEIVDSGDHKHLQAGTSIELLRSGRRGTCSYAAKYASKLQQKMIPDFFLMCGRFWGVEGHRKCMSATIAWHADYVNSPDFIEFRRLLAEILAGTPESVRKIGLTGSSRGIYIQDDVVCSLVKYLILRFGMKVIASGAGAVEFPLVDAEELLK